MLINSPNISGSLKVTGNTVITGSLTVLGGINATITGSATTASYVEYSNVANKPTLVSGSAQVSFNGITDKPTLVSGSSQVTYSGLSGIPAGIVSGSSQISFNGIVDKPTLVSGSSQVTYSGISGIPSGIVSSSAQVGGYGIFATTGSNTFAGNQTITGSIFGTGSLTIDGCITATGQIVAQTINVQQVTSSIVYSCGSNIFGTSISNTQQFTGSMLATGSLTLAGPMIGSSTACFGGNITTSGCVSIGTPTAATPLHIVTAGLPTIRLTLGSEARCHNINGVNLGRDLQVLPFRHFSVQTGNGIAEGQIVLNAYEDFIVGTGASYTSRLTITPTGIACFACQVCAPAAIFSGCVGIGITSPVATLDAISAVTGIYASSTQQVVARFYNLPASLGSGNNSAFLSLQTSADGGNSNPVARIGVVGESYGSNNAAFVVATRDGSGVTERMRITSGGNVGIGTTSPNNTLTVNACGANKGIDLTINNATTVARFGVTDPNINNNPYIGGFSNNDFLLYSNSQVRLTLTNTGIACFACQVCAPFMVSGRFFSCSSAVGNTTINTPTALISIPTPVFGNGVYLFTAYLSGTGAPSTDYSTALISADSNAYNLTNIKTGSNMVISLSGCTIQGTQCIFTGADISWTYTRLL